MLNQSLSRAKRSPRTYKMLSATSYIAIALLLAATLIIKIDACVTAAPSNETRQFRRLNGSDVICSKADSTARVENCTGKDVDNDCLIEEIHPSSGGGDSHRALQKEEWLDLKNKLAELAQSADTEDEYPDTMPVSKPLKLLRNRVCPVRYKVLMYPDTVPMLIVHAECIRNKPAIESQGNLTCKEIKHFRQVYKRLEGCKAKNSSDERVYIKHFEIVSVNCAAQYA